MADNMFTGKRAKNYKLTSDDEREIFIEAWNCVHDNLDDAVLGFIFDAMQHCGRENEEVVYNFFRRGYCYYFAHMLKLAFRRGTVCVAAPLGHFVWMDDNGVPYDADGVNESCCQAYIPEEFMGDMVKDFLHVKGEGYNASQEAIQELIRRYRASKESNPGK